MCEMLGMEFYEIGIHDGEKDVLDYEKFAFDVCEVV